MSEAARTALMNIGSYRQGATVPPLTTDETRQELKELGYLGKSGGLTRKGSIKRQQLLDAEMDALFN